MADDPNLSPTEKLLYLGRVAWSQVGLPRALARLSVAAEHMRERAFPLGAVLAREGEPVASAYVLVRGRVAVSRRGMVLGEAEPGSIVGLEALLSQDQLGIGVVAATDVLALEVESDTLLGILGDHFPLVHDAIQVATRRLLALTRRLGPRDESSGLPFRPPAGRPMNLVELLLFLRTPGGPFERSSIDAVAELAGMLTQTPYEAGHFFWKEGERAGHVCVVVEGSVACTSSRDGPSSRFRVGPGRQLGALESVAGESRWYDAVAETAGIVLHLDVDRLIDLFEDNVDIALDYLAWVNRTTLELIEAAMGPGRELLEFFATGSAPPGSTAAIPRKGRG
jgi:CRP-like cAMP-binding protein